MLCRRYINKWKVGLLVVCNVDQLHPRSGTQCKASYMGCHLIGLPCALLMPSIQTNHSLATSSCRTCSFCRPMSKPLWVRLLRYSLSCFCFWLPTWQHLTACWALFVPPMLRSLLLLLPSGGSGGHGQVCWGHTHLANIFLAH